MMHLLIGAKPGLLSTFFSLVKKRLCSPELKHCLNVYSVLLCALGYDKFTKQLRIDNGDFGVVTIRFAFLLISP